MSDRSVRPEPVEGRWTLAQSLARAQAQGLERIDAQLLHLFALGRAPQERAWLIAHDNDPLDEATLARLEPLLQRRATGDDVQVDRGMAIQDVADAVDDAGQDPRPAIARAGVVAAAAGEQHLRAEAQDPRDEFFARYPKIAEPVKPCRNGTRKRV